MTVHLQAAFWGAVLGLGLCLTVSGCVWGDLQGAGLSSFGLFLAGIAVLACLDLRERGI